MGRGESNLTRINRIRVIRRYDELRESKRKEEEGKTIKQSKYLGEQYYYDLISDEIGYEPITVRKIINNRKKYMKLYGLD